jgi:hypothetical protein
VDTPHNGLNETASLFNLKKPPEGNTDEANRVFFGNINVFMTVFLLFKP